MDYSQLTSYLFSLKPQGSKYGIDRMRLLIDLIGHSERSFPIIHVAGTNGKGTVCAMLDAIYKAHGYKRGLFTSPHLVHLEERIQINRAMISKEEMLSYVEYLKEIADKTLSSPDDYPSFFEMMNAMGFLHFAKNKVDIAIIETGLGGEFDSTNVVSPLVSVITSISKEHTEILGDNIEAIAKAKAGIIKENTPVVIGPMPAVAEAVIRYIAHQKKAKIYSIEKDLKDYPQTNFPGSYNQQNAAVALLTAKVISDQFPIDDTNTKKTLMHVDWPGRWEQISVESRKVILDCMHNEGGAHVIAENLEQLIQIEGKKPTIIIGLLGEHKSQEVIPIIAPYAHSLILVKPKNERGVPLESLEKAIPSNFKGEVISGEIEKIFPGGNKCTLKEENRTILITGSIYLIGEVKERIKLNN